MDWTGQNIYWTLFLGVLVLTLWEQLGQYRGIPCQIARIAVLPAICSAAFLFSTDYRYMGILLIFTFYLTRDKRLPIQILSVGFVMLFGTWSANCIRYADSFTVDYLFRFSLREMYGLFAFLLIAGYDGERGKQLPKPFYYGFYPVHLLFLYGIAQLTGIM